MSTNSAKASSKKKSQKSAKSEVEDASELRLREIAREMESGTQLKEQTPLWYRVIMFSLLAVGILWIIVFYITQGLFPIPDLGMWNVSVGVGAMMVSMLMMTGWRYFFRRYYFGFSAYRAAAGPGGAPASVCVVGCYRVLLPGSYILI